MKTAYKIFKDRPELMEEAAVQELIKSYEKVCDDFIDLSQVTEMSKEIPLKELINQIRSAINDEIKNDEEAIPEPGAARCHAQAPRHRARSIVA